MYAVIIARSKNKAFHFCVVGNFSRPASQKEQVFQPALKTVAFICTCCLVIKFRPRGLQTKAAEERQWGIEGRRRLMCKTTSKSAAQCKDLVDETAVKIRDQELHFRSCQRPKNWSQLL